MKHCIKLIYINCEECMLVWEVSFSTKISEFYSWEQQPEPQLFYMLNKHLKYLIYILIMSNCSRHEKTMGCFLLYSKGHNHLYDLDPQQKKSKTDFIWQNMNNMFPILHKTQLALYATLLSSWRNLQLCFILQWGDVRATLHVQCSCCAVILL